MSVVDPSPNKHRMYCLDRKAVSTLDSMHSSLSPIDKKESVGKAGRLPYTMRQSKRSAHRHTVTLAIRQQKRVGRTLLLSCRVGSLSRLRTVP